MKVLEKIDIDKRYFLIKTDFKEKVLPGQFFMLRSWENYPTLSRPISIFDFSQGADFFNRRAGRRHKFT
ncbi:dihydroorotate dehydrogenase, electron transfer subunit domain protein [Peptoniphilus sp. BV3C26]|nr:dihydroorotate dehydrogenase, electron transfer subunit domain protein [Peptoniphilus sp. BV3C26]